MSGKAIHKTLSNIVVILMLLRPGQVVQEMIVPGRNAERLANQSVDVIVPELAPGNETPQASWGH
jgi:hypothetical protein